MYRQLSVGSCENVYAVQEELAARFDFEAPFKAPHVTLIGMSTVRLRVHDLYDRPETHKGRLDLASKSLSDLALPSSQLPSRLQSQWCHVTSKDIEPYRNSIRIILPKHVALIKEREEALKNLENALGETSDTQRLRAPLHVTVGYVPDIDCIEDITEYAQGMFQPTTLEFEPVCRLVDSSRLSVQV